MAHVKIGRDVKTSGDMQNLVTSILLRAEGKFTLEEVLTVINWNLAGSSYHRSEETEKCLKNTLSILERDGTIRQKNGLYEVGMLLI